MMMGAALRSRTNTQLFPAETRKHPVNNHQFRKGLRKRPLSGHPVGVRIHPVAVTVKELTDHAANRVVVLHNDDVTTIGSFVRTGSRSTRNMR
jgi:methionine aminopeptidase